MKKHNNNKQCCYNKLSCCALGLAFAITWGVAMFLLAIINIYCNWGASLLDILASVYIGFDFTVKGAFIGLLWGLLDGFIFGLLVALIYNFSISHCFYTWFKRKHKRHSCGCE